MIISKQIGTISVAIFAIAVSTTAPSALALSGDSDCKADGYQFNAIKWSSSFSNENAAQSHIQTLSQPTYSHTQTPIKDCCSKTATPNAMRMACRIAQKPLGETGLPESAKNLCAQPDVEYIVGYSWACTARSESAKLVAKTE